MRKLPIALLALIFLFALSASAAVSPRTATFETDFAPFSTNTSNAALARTNERAYEGSYSAMATELGFGNAYGRGVFYVDWPIGTDVWFGAAFWLPPGTRAGYHYPLDILRHDNYGTLGGAMHKVGVGLWNGEWLVTKRVGGHDSDFTRIAGPLELPEGRWFFLELHQQLSGTDGLTEVFVDGARVASSTVPPTYGREVNRLRVGLVGDWPSQQYGPLYFDRAYIADNQLGPLGAQPVCP
jgi:hypothetical protein